MPLMLSTIVKPYGRGFHIFCFSESRLNNHMDDKDIAIEGFHVIRKDPQIQRETGLVVYVHETVSVTRLTEFERYGVECIWLEVKLQKTSPVLVGFLHRNPSCRTGIHAYRDWWLSLKLKLLISLLSVSVVGGSLVLHKTNTNKSNSTQYLHLPSQGNLSLF